MTAIVVEQRCSVASGLNIRYLINASIVLYVILKSITDEHSSAQLTRLNDDLISISSLQFFYSFYIVQFNVKAPTTVHLDWVLPSSDGNVRRKL